MRALLLSAVVLLMMPCAAVTASELHAPSAPATAPSAAAVSTRLALRGLWVEHVFWARNYVLAVAGSDPARATVAADEVVANAKAISAAIVPFYGEAAGEQLLGLLAGHWGAVKAFADAHLAGDAAAAEQATTQLGDNAAAIATFLSGANPYLPKDALVGLLTAHGAHHVAQTRQIKAGEHAAEAQTWAAMRQHMLVIADALTDALARQFPDKV